MKKTTVIVSFFLLSLSSQIVSGATYQHRDELSNNDKTMLNSVAKGINANESSLSILAQMLEGATSNDPLYTKTYQVKDMLTAEFFNKNMAGFVTNTNEQEALESFLNLLGFGGPSFKKHTFSADVLNQYLPRVSIVKMDNGITNVRFENVPIKDKGFNETVTYYNSIDKRYRDIPKSVSNQTAHDDMLKFAFFGKGDRESANLPALSREAAQNQAGEKLPFVEIIAKYMSAQLTDLLKDSDDTLVFSGKGFAGAIAQEVAYNSKKSEVLKEKPIKVVTSQAMRYLSGSFKDDYNQVLGIENVQSIDFNRIKHITDLFPDLSLSYKEVYFNTLGTQVRLETKAPTNGFFDSTFKKIGLNNELHLKNFQDGVLFKNSQTLKQQACLVLENTLEKGQTLNPNEFLKLANIMEKAKSHQESSNALATLIAGEKFLKTSAGEKEAKNLKKIRDYFIAKKIITDDSNTPQKIALGNNIFFIMPAFYYDAVQDVTVTISDMAGKKSYKEHLEEALGQDSFTDTGFQMGEEIGQILAAVHNEVKISHNDFHLNNIRFNGKEKFIIDVESMANNIDNALNIKDKMHLNDVLQLLAKTIAHKIKSSTYGASKRFWSSFFLGGKITQTEKAFVDGFLKSYFETIKLSSCELVKMKDQYKKFVQSGNSVERFLGTSGIASTFGVYNQNVINQMHLSRIGIKIDNKIEEKKQEEEKNKQQEQERIEREKRDEEELENKLKMHQAKIEQERLEQETKKATTPIKNGFFGFSFKLPWIN